MDDTTTTSTPEGLLSPYRVLDLTDEKGYLCGKLLGDLGADVIKIEPPDGDPDRNQGPFFHQEDAKEKSLFWFAYNCNKRGITLDIEETQGRGILKKLVESADFLIESFSPGYLEELDLGYSSLEKINPGLIMVSITPFGQTGPYKNFKGPDIVVWAMGGRMYAIGDEDRPPTRISHHSQAYLQGSVEAAAGAMMAFYHRQENGEGQHVDVSIQAAAAQTGNMGWDLRKVVPLRRAVEQRSGRVRITRRWPCKNGRVSWMYRGGQRAAERTMQPFFKWMEREGFADDFLAKFNWEEFEINKANQQTIDRIEAPISRFFQSFTKEELLEGAVRNRIIFYPTFNTADILESPQLEARNFWEKVEHPELNTSLTYPGAFAKFSDNPITISRRAPLIGEHNEEILQQELGLKSDAVEAEQVDRPGFRRTVTSIQEVKKAQRMLEGLKIADFSTVIAGPLTTKPLASHGATVLKIEGRGHPGLFRQSVFPQPHMHSEISSLYNPWLNRGPAIGLWNTGKLSIALDLTRERGKEIARELVAWADVVVENFAGGAMQRMGLGYEELKKVKPDLIMLSSCMQGQTGPHAKHPGYGTQLANLAGFCSIAGWPDREPTMIGPYTDYIAPRFNLVAILAALDYRRRTGKGQYIDVSQFEIGLQFMAPLLLETAANGQISERVGNYSPSAAPHGVYPCVARHTERYCIIAVYTDEEWQNFCDVMGNPDWTQDAKFSTRRSRRDNELELDQRVEEWTSQYLPEQIVRRLLDVEVWAAVPESKQEWLEHNPPIKDRSPYSAPHGIYRCHQEDRWCSIAVYTEVEWQSFCDVIGNPQWTRQSTFKDLPARLQNLQRLDKLVAEWTEQRTAEEVMMSMQEAGVAAGLLATGEDSMEKDPQLRHRQLYWPLQHPEIGEFHGVAPSFILSKYDHQLTRPPLMGEHNEFALKEFLGMSDDQIKELIREGVLE